MPGCPCAKRSAKSHPIIRAEAGQNFFDVGLKRRGASGLVDGSIVQPVEINAASTQYIQALPALGRHEVNLSCFGSGAPIGLRLRKARFIQVGQHHFTTL